MSTKDDSGSRRTRRMVAGLASTAESDESTRITLPRMDATAPLTRLHSLLRTLHAHVDTYDDEELQQGLAIAETSMRELNTLAFGPEETDVMARGERAMQCVGARIDDIVRFTVHALHDFAVQRRVRIRWTSSSECAWLFCDEERVSLVLFDLIRNAISRTPSGSEVVVRTWCSGSEVGVEIHDGGSELSEAERMMIAAPLWRRSWTTSDTALGLCIAWVVAIAHGGHVSVESAPGLGTSMWFVLPRGLLH